MHLNSNLNVIFKLQSIISTLKLNLNEMNGYVTYKGSKILNLFSQCRNIVYNKKKRAKRDKRRAKKDSGSESSDSVQVEKPVPHPVEKVTPLHDRRMSLTEDLVQVEKTIEKPTISGKKKMIV